MKELLILVVIAIILLFFAFLILVTTKIMDLWIGRRQKKFEERHPDYIVFLNKYHELQQEALDIWNHTIPNKSKEVNWCIEAMKYLPKSSEQYKYYEYKLDVTRRKILECKEEYEAKRYEIDKFVNENKTIIESISEERPEEYQNFVEMFNLENI